MTVAELIAELKKLPPGMSVTVWDADEDDDVDVTGVVHELGHTTIQIMTHGMEKEYREATAEEMDE